MHHGIEPKPGYRTYPKFGSDIFAMGKHRIYADFQSVGYFLVDIPHSYKAKHIDFPLRQVVLCAVIVLSMSSDDAA